MSTLTGVQLVQKRMYALSERLGWSRAEQIRVLFEEYLGHDLGKHKFSDTLRMAIEQAAIMGAESFQELLHEMETKMSRRVYLFMVCDKTALQRFRYNNYLNTIHSLNLDSLFNNRNIIQLNENMVITNIFVNNGHLVIRFGQIRNCSTLYGGTATYYYLAHTDINLTNGLCILYLDNKKNKDNGEWNDIVSSLCEKIRFVLALLAEDLVPFEIGIILTSRLKTALQAAQQITADCNLYINTTEQILGISLGGIAGSTSASRKQALFSEHIRKELDLQLNRGEYVKKLKCLITVTPSKIIDITYGDSGQISCGNGLLIEGEMENVISRLLTDQQNIANSSGGVPVHP